MIRALRYVGVGVIFAFMGLLQFYDLGGGSMGYVVQLKIFRVGVWFFNVFAFFFSLFRCGKSCGTWTDRFTGSLSHRLEGPVV